MRGATPQKVVVYLLDLSCIDAFGQRPTWLQNAPAKLDRAVWDAYGWPEDEIPAEVEEDVILSRLLALNGERAGR